MNEGITLFICSCIVYRLLKELCKSENGTTKRFFCVCVCVRVQFLTLRSFWSAIMVKLNCLNEIVSR